MFQDGWSPIGRAIVDDDELEILERLRQDAFHGLAQKRLPVVNRHDNAHQGRQAH